MTESIIVTGTIACGAVFEILMQRRGELMMRFPSFFTPLDRTEVLFPDPERYPYEKVESVAREFGARLVLPLGDGGIFKGLWDLGEAAGKGLQVDIKRIPLRQEAVEILEYFDRNIYEENARGSVLIATEDGVGLLEALRKEGIEAELIGALVSGRAKTLVYEEHTRYLDKPRRREK